MTHASVRTEDQIGAGSTTNSAVPHAAKIWEGKCHIKPGDGEIQFNCLLFLRENLPGQFKFKEYCPQVFRNLRERFGIEDQDYQV